MIKANELRVGNCYDFVNPMSGGEKTIVQFVYWDEGLNMEAYGEPIPLTPEILEKCGFEKDGFNSYNLSLPAYLTTSVCTLVFAADYLYLRQENNHRRSDDSVCVLWNKDLMKTFYLHQLQNLVFSLTGEELTINL